MPLHLLPKKSWNPYSATAIARVQADEAAAAAADRAYADRLAAHEAARRRAQLRGDPEPTTRLPTPPGAITSSSTDARKRGRERGRDEHGSGEPRKKLRRRAGEDETAWEIRAAREEHAAAAGWAGQADDGDAAAAAARQGITHDARGHMQLFAPQRAAAATSADAKHVAAEDADGAGMRFKHAAGYATDISRRPWYYSGTEEVGEAAAAAESLDDRSRARERRQQARVAASDPMAAMKRAQGRLKEVERERDEWRREREAEMRVLHEEQEREERRRKRRRDLDDKGLEGFSLDAPSVNVDSGGASRRRDEDSRGHRRRHRSRSREKHEGKSHRHDSPGRSTRHSINKHRHDRHDTRRGQQLETNSRQHSYS